jgi:hypothetical protein
MASSQATGFAALTAEKRAALNAAVEQLPAADREILSFTLDVLYALIEGVEQLSSAVRGLDLLDDLRAARIERLADQIAAYAPEGSSAVTGESLRVAAPAEPEPASLELDEPVPTAEQRAYWTQMQRLRDRRRADAGELAQLREEEPDGYRVDADYTPAFADDPEPWQVHLFGPKGSSRWSVWTDIPSVAVEQAHKKLDAIRAAAGDEAS